MTLHKKHYLRFFLIAIATLFYFLANIQRSAIPGAIFNLLQSDFCANAGKITLLGAIITLIVQIISGSLPLGALIGLGIIFGFRAVSHKKMDLLNVVIN